MACHDNSTINILVVIICIGVSITIIYSILDPSSSIMIIYNGPEMCSGITKILSPLPLKESSSPQQYTADTLFSILHYMDT